MTAALERLAQRDALATRLGQAAATTVRERFDIARMVRQVESLYGEVLQPQTKQ
jgi:glycosyltransferase involved in cell wall biosynthesis